MGLLYVAAQPVVYGTLFLIGAIKFAIGIYLYEEFDSSSFLLISAMGLVYWAFMFCIRRKIELTAKLIEQSIIVSADHPGVYLASFFILIFNVLFSVATVFAFYVVVIGGFEIDTTVNTGIKNCYSLQYVEPSKPALVALVVFLYWTSALWECIRFVVVSFTTGAWYFKNQSLASQEGTISDKEYMRAPVSTGLKLAFTKSFGSICFAALILAICEYLRDLERRNRRGGLVGCLISCCIRCILAYLEFLTRFAITIHALSGDDFCTSGKTFLTHCKNHGFTAITIDWLSRLTLRFGAFVLALMLTAITVGSAESYAFQSPETKITVLIILGLLAFIIAIIILDFIAMILLNIIDAAYGCLVLDLDSAAATRAFRRPEIAQAVLVISKPDYVLGQVPDTNQPVAEGQVVYTGGVQVGQPVNAAVATNQARP